MSHAITICYCLKNDGRCPPSVTQPPTKLVDSKLQLSFVAQLVVHYYGYRFGVHDDQSLFRTRTLELQPFLKAVGAQNTGFSARCRKCVLQSENPRLYRGMSRPEIALVRNGRTGRRRLFQSIDRCLRSECVRSSSVSSELGRAAIGKTQEMCDRLRGKAYQHKREGNRGDCDADVSVLRSPVLSEDRSHFRLRLRHRCGD